MRQMILRRFLWGSLLLHLLFLLSFTIAFTFPSSEEAKKPSLEIPAYVYKGEATQQPQALQQQRIEKRSSAGIEKPITPSTKLAQPKQQTKAAHANPNTQAIHLVGDKNTPPKPLVKLLGKGLAAHLRYPKIAADFNLKGVALVGFTLHPDGRVVGAQIVKSSGAEVLDEAALAGVNAMSPLKEVDLYLQAPQFLVVGIIFSNNEPMGRLMI